MNLRNSLMALKLNFASDEKRLADIARVGFDAWIERVALQMKALTAPKASKINPFPERF